MNIEESHSVSFMYFISYSHLQLADQLVTFNKELEDKYNYEDFPPDQSSLSKSYSIGAVIASVAFLECNINELFERICEEHGILKSTNSKLSETNKKKCLIWWNNKGNRGKPAIQKYKKVLELNGKKKLDHKDSMYQDINNLVYLRNCLTHFSPEWITTESEFPDINVTPQSIAEKFKGKFPPSKFFEKSNNPYYPDKVLGLGCSEWALNLVLTFAEEVYDRLEIKVPYSHILEGLSNVK